MSEYYNKSVANPGDRYMIALRALPGNVSKQYLYGPAGAIGNDEFDSYCSGPVYVIRRACQVLPCFLIYY